MKSPKVKGIGEVVTDYGAKVMKIFKKGLLGRSLFDFYGDVKANAIRVKESSSVPQTPVDNDGGVVYVKNSDGKLYYKSNEVSEVELSASDAVLTTEQVQDIAGPLVATGGTKTNIAVTYDDASGNMDFVVASDLNTTGSAATLTTARTIGGVSFNGSANIDLPGVSETGDQDTSGNAATATILATARAINGVDFNGSAPITITAAGSTLSDTVPVSKGGTGRSAFADKAVIITQDSGTDTLAAVTMFNNGELLIGGTDGPAVATLTQGNGLTITNANGGITLAVDVDIDTTGESGTVDNIGSLTGDVTSSNRATTIANDAVTYAKMQNVSATNVVLGRDSAGAGVVEEISAASLRTIINVEDGATADQTNVTGSSGSCTGNAATATALATARAINGVDFDGSAAITVTAAGSTLSDTVTVAKGGTGRTSLADNSLLTGNGTTGIIAESNLTYDGTNLTLASDAISAPDLIIKSTVNHPTAGNLVFNKFRDDDTPPDGMMVGIIQWASEDDANNAQIYAQVIGSAEETGSGSEGGKLQLKIATHDGEVQDGIVIEDGDAEDEVDVTIGQGANSLTTIAGNLTTVGGIELGHATDTTLARSAAGIATIEGKQIFTTNTPALTSAAAGVPAVTMQIRRTITTAEANALNSTPIELIPAQGANTVIVLAGGIIRIDRAATQTNSAADMNLHYEGLEPGTFAQTTLFHARRFMYNETGDRVFNIIPGMSAYEVAQSLTQDVNKAVEVSVTSALTSNCITSMDIYLTYHVFNIS